LDLILPFQRSSGYVDGVARGTRARMYKLGLGAWPVSLGRFRQMAGDKLPDEFDFVI
jgi:hypothetical protein